MGLATGGEQQKQRKGTGSGTPGAPPRRGHHQYRRQCGDQHRQMLCADRVLHLHRGTGELKGRASALQVEGCRRHRPNRPNRAKHGSLDEGNAAWPNLATLHLNTTNSSNSSNSSRVPEWGHQICVTSFKSWGQALCGSAHRRSHFQIPP